MMKLLMKEVSGLSSQHKAQGTMEVVCGQGSDIVQDLLVRHIVPVAD